MFPVLLAEFIGIQVVDVPDIRGLRIDHRSVEWSELQARPRGEIDRCCEQANSIAGMHGVVCLGHGSTDANRPSHCRSALSVNALSGMLTKLVGFRGCNRSRLLRGVQMASFRELLNKAKAEIREVDPGGAEEMLDEGAILLDVREADEFEQGAVPDSLFLARGNLESQVEGRIPDKSAPVVIMCAGGIRSVFAAVHDAGARL